MKLAIIPARGGSQRVRRKNIKVFLGQPIIHYVVQTALQSGLFDRVVVSTDDDEIAAVARQCGAEVPFVRPAELSDGHTVVADVVRHAIAWFEARGESVAVACCLYATAPLLNAGDLARGLCALEQGEGDFALSVCRYPFPIQRALKMGTNNSLAMIQPEHRNTRSQDLADCYHDAAHFYGGTRDAFMNRLSGPTVGVVVPRDRVCDIDSEEDWRYAEIMAQAYWQKEGGDV